MPVETWYLSKQATALGKRLGRLKGWRKGVAQLLLSTESDEKVKVDIKKLVTTDKPEKQSEIVSQTVALLPKTSRSKAKILGQHLVNNLHIDENGRIVYPDGSFGSDFIDTLKYFTAPKSGKARAPFDVVKMTAFLRDTHFPIPAVSRDVEMNFDAEKKWISL